MGSYTNADGLLVRNGLVEGAVNDQGLTMTSVKKYLVLDIPDATLIPSAAADPVADDPFIPAGSYITSATLMPSVTFDSSGDAATLTIGTQTLAGADIDADGIDATIAEAALASTAVVACNGAQVAGVVNVGTANAYVSFLYGTEAFTAGAAKLVIEYIEG